jgi:branched-chain amino acid transport system permease protein
MIRATMTGSRFRRIGELVGLMVLLLVFLSVPAWANKGVQFLAAVAMVQIVFALSFNMIFGLCGLLSFGHAAYFASGAYAAGLLLQSTSTLSIFVVLAIGASVGGLIAIAVGLLAMRRASGVYFAILTLALAELLHIVISKSPYLGREDGLTGIARPEVNLGVATIDLGQGSTLYYFVLVLTVLFGALAWMLWNGSFGRSIAAIRQDPERAAFLGINVHRSRLIIFALSGVGSGFAGALYAPLAQLLTPEVAHWSFSALPLLFCLLGGAASFWGPIAGVVMFLGLEHATRNIVGLSEVVIGLVLLFVVLVFPGGIIGGVRKLLSRLEKPASPEHNGGDVPTQKLGDV